MAQPFDVSRAARAGDAVPLAEPVMQVPVLRGAFSASTTGVLTYVVQTQDQQRLTWFDRNGRPQGTVGDPGTYSHLALSPDDRRLAYSHSDGTNRDIFVMDLAGGGGPMRVTTDPGQEFDPVFTTDGADLVFNSNRDRSFALYRRPANGGGQDARIVKLDVGNMQVPEVARDGSVLVFSGGAAGALDLWVLPLSGGGQPTPMWTTPALETSPALSADVHWVAYSSNETGRTEIYVQAFPAGGDRHVISHSGGHDPRWRRDGRELYFLSPDGTMMAARIDASHGFQSTLEPLFETGITVTNGHPYAVTQDGQRFLYPVTTNPVAPRLTVVLNWMSELGTAKK